uniref:Protein kinase domain-containing protein n=1 Tax=Macrostomum lignano TaxID=282301 RepID=A0A1I8F5P9_9PLAT
VPQRPTVLPGQRQPPCTAAMDQREQCQVASVRRYVSRSSSSQPPVATAATTARCTLYRRQLPPARLRRRGSHFKRLRQPRTGGSTMAFFSAGAAAYLPEPTPAPAPAPAPAPSAAILPVQSTATTTGTPARHRCPGRTASSWTTAPASGVSVATATSRCTSSTTLPPPAPAVPRPPAQQPGFDARLEHLERSLNDAMESIRRQTSVQQQQQTRQSHHHQHHQHHGAGRRISSTSPFEFRYSQRTMTHEPPQPIGRGIHDLGSGSRVIATQVQQQQQQQYSLTEQRGTVGRVSRLAVRPPEAGARSLSANRNATLRASTPVSPKPLTVGGSGGGGGGGFSPRRPSGGNGGCGGRAANGGSGGRLLITRRQSLPACAGRGRPARRWRPRPHRLRRAADWRRRPAPASAAEWRGGCAGPGAELAGPTLTRTWRAAAACGTLSPALAGVRGQQGKAGVPTGGPGRQPGKPGYVIWSVIDAVHRRGHLPQPSVVTTLLLSIRSGLAVRRTRSGGHQRPPAQPARHGAACGAVLSFASTDSLAMRKSETLHLAEAEPNEQYTVTALFHGRCLTCQLRTSRCATRAKRKSGRQSAWLAGSSQGVGCTRKVRIRHPVVLSAVNLPPQMAAASSDQPVGLQFWSHRKTPPWPPPPAPARSSCASPDRRMLVAAAEPTGSGGDLGDPGYDTVYVGIRNLPAKSSLVVRFPMLLEDKAELFDHVLCQVELYMHGKLVEYCSNTVRVAPYFVVRDPPATRCSSRAAAPPAAASCSGSACWRPSTWTWTSAGHERYEGFSFFRDTGLRLTWVDRYGDRLLIVPDYRPELVCGLDLARHFTLAARLGDSAALLIAGDRARLAPPGGFAGRRARQAAGWPTAAPAGCCIPSACVGADREEAVKRKRIRRILRDLNADSAASAAPPRRRCPLPPARHSPRRLLPLSYGEAEFRRLGLPRNGPPRLFWSCAGREPLECCRRRLRTDCLAVGAVDTDRLTERPLPPPPQLYLICLSLLPSCSRRKLYNLKPLRPPSTVSAAADNEDDDGRSSVCAAWATRWSWPLLAAMSVQAYLSDEISDSMRFVRLLLCCGPCTYCNLAGFAALPVSDSARGTLAKQEALLAGRRTAAAMPHRPLRPTQDCPKLKSLSSDVARNAASYSRNQPVSQRVIFYLRDYRRQAMRFAPQTAAAGDPAGGGRGAAGHERGA